GPHRAAASDARPSGRGRPRAGARAPPPRPAARPRARRRPPAGRRAARAAPGPAPPPPAPAPAPARGPPRAAPRAAPRRTVAQPPVAGGGVAVDDLAHQRLGLVAGERERAAVVADAEVAGDPAQVVVVDEDLEADLVGDAQRVLLDLPVGEQVVVRVHVGEA